MPGRIRNAADFQRLLATPPCKRSAHFMVHFLNEPPQTMANSANRVESEELSTELAMNRKNPVDKSSAASAEWSDDGARPHHWLGYVVPKRHARRAVTRSLVKRQMRAVVAHHESRLEPGLWLIRLGRPFAAAQYPSATSPALRAAVRQELESLLTQCERMSARLAAKAQGG